MGMLLRRCLELDKIDGKNLNGGHNSDDESGKRAEQYGKIKDLKANEN